jgi:hypothetical protein
MKHGSDLEEMAKDVVDHADPMSNRAVRIVDTLVEYLVPIGSIAAGTFIANPTYLAEPYNVIVPAAAVGVVAGMCLLDSILMERSINMSSMDASKRNILLKEKESYVIRQVFQNILWGVLGYAPGPNGHENTAGSVLEIVALGGALYSTIDSSRHRKYLTTKSTEFSK